MNKKTAEQLVLVCKTYEGDIESFKRLIESYNRYNKDSLKLYVSVPENDLLIFKKLGFDNIELVADESYAKDYFSSESYWGLPLGYVNQEICKLSFWELNIAENYLFVDSDAYFIRDFFKRDFINENNVPYSVLVMDKDLNLEKHYSEFGAWRKQQIKKIFDYVDYKDERLLTCHGMTVMSSQVLKDMKAKLLKTKNLDYKSLIEISPYEYTWYNAWLQKSNIIPVIGVEPFFKTYHMRIEYIFSKLRLITEKDLAQQYVGVILNSNWKPKSPPSCYGKTNTVEKLFYKAVERL